MLVRVLGGLNFLSSRLGVMMRVDFLSTGRLIRRGISVFAERVVSRVVRELSGIVGLAEVHVVVPETTAELLDVALLLLLELAHFRKEFHAAHVSVIFCHVSWSYV